MRLAGETQQPKSNIPEKYGDLVSQHRGASTSWYLFDAIGATRYLTNSSGVPTDHYLYDANGNRLASSGSTMNPFQYIGRNGYYFDEECNISYVRARIYQPSIMRWWSVDPLGFIDGINLYLYLANNPLFGIDPSGLSWGGKGTGAHKKAQKKLEKLLLANCEKFPTKSNKKNQCAQSDCKNEAKKLAKGFFFTLERNWSWGRQAPWGQGYQGCWCYDWAGGFDQLVDLASPKGCFSGEVQMSFTPDGKVHYWLKIANPHSSSDVYIDDSFGNGNDFVHTTPPNPPGWKSYYDEAALPTTTSCMPVKPYFCPPKPGTYTPDLTTHYDDCSLEVFDPSGP